tara:strand:+ start:7142 stop:8356 length:1215 start_codon:yes stop_codon:yes gene_type:complete
LSERFQPGSPHEVRDLLAWAAAEQVPFEIVGAGSKRGFGHDVAASHQLDLTRLSGFIDYEPAELVLTAHAATPIAEIDAVLRQSHQQLAFEPPDLGPLLGHGPEQATLGGTLAANLSGPRRVQTGAARDHALGVTVATGRGELIKSGGRVVKNVSGYDLTKLMCGSWGTLGVMTSVSVKVLPAPEKTRTLLISGLSATDACRAMNQALSSPHEVTAVAFLPQGLTARSGVSYLSGAGAAITAVRVEGPPVSVAARHEALVALLGSLGEIEELHGHNSTRFWGEVRDVLPLLPGDASVWRVSVPPASGGDVMAWLDTHEGEGYLDWGGGLVWAALPAEQSSATALRELTDSLGGRATLVRGPDGFRNDVPVFNPQPETRAALSQRIKDGFDPLGILNPGRMSGSA